MSEIISINDIQATEQRLRVIADNVKDKLAQAENMACTEETKQAVKKFRAELKKEFDSYEVERKEKTAEYEAPLRVFKDIYNRLIAVPFKEADTQLKSKIDAVETAQKAEKEQAVRDYAEELKAAHALDWLDTSRIMPPVTLSTSEKSLKAQVTERLDQIHIDALAAQIDETGETFAEYQKCLNLGAAQKIVADRKATVEAAKKSLEALEKQEEIKQKAAEKVEQLAPPEIDNSKPEVQTYSMTFTVIGTIEQLKALKGFMIENGIEFKNGINDKK